MGEPRCELTELIVTHCGHCVGADPLYARLFFGIWLAPQSSAPALRQSLLGLPG